MEHSEIASSSATSVHPLEDAPSIGYICPLYTELAAVLATFDEDLGTKEIDEDDYYYGRVGNRMAVAIQFLYGDMGPQAASRCADRLLKEHPTLIQPRSFCLLVGIAGGIWTEDRDVRLGDAVIATRIWNWRDGKLTESGLETTNFPENISRRLRRKLPSFLYTRDVLGHSIAQRIKLMRKKDRANDLRWMYPGHEHDRLYIQSYAHVSGTSCATHDASHRILRPRREDNLPKVHDGLLASGNVVLKDAKSRDLLHDKRVYAVEMEACGISNDFLVVRGISDYADSHKNDIWQPYAAAVAAACARLLIDHLIAIEHQDSPHPHRIMSCPSDVPSASRLQKTPSKSLTFSGTGDRLMQQLPLRRATQSDIVVTAASDAPSATITMPSKELTMGREAAPQVPSENVSESAVNTPSRSNIADTSKAVETQKLHSRGTQVNVLSTTTVPSSMANDIADFTPQKMGHTCHLGVWKQVDYEIKHYIIDRQVWKAPTVTMMLPIPGGIHPTCKPHCFLTFATKGTDERFCDRVWLPLNGLRIKTLDSSIETRYGSAIYGSSPGSISVELTSSSPDIRLLFIPQDTSDTSSKSLIETVLQACRSMIPGSPTPGPALNNEVVHGIVPNDRDLIQNVLYVHETDRLGCHLCTLTAFSDDTLNFYTKWFSDHVEVHLKEMYCLRYSISRLEMFTRRVETTDVPPTIMAYWVPAKEAHKISRDLAPNCMEALLDDVIGKLTGWTAIYATQGVSLSSLHNRNANRLQSSLISKATAVVYRATSSNCLLTAWQKGDSIRFFFLVSEGNEEANKYGGAWDEWTITAGLGEVFLGKDHNVKLKVAFEFEKPSRSDYDICITPTNWFTLASSGRTCGNAISLKFPSPESYTRFKQCIPDGFWR